jgi:hypothetical protein
MLGETSNTILLMAFLRQPIILRGHHQDLKGGVELLDKLAQTINGLGPVSWSNMTGVCRSNYRWCLDGTVCRIQPLGRSIRLSVPSATTHLVIEDPQKRFTADWQLCFEDGEVLACETETPISFSGEKGNTVLLRAAPGAAPNAGRRRTPIPAIIRRVLTEGRDRFLA